jgi:hypothetical protein
MAGSRKLPKRSCKQTKPASPSTTTSTTSSPSKTSHPYLAEREVSAIEHWNDSIPSKATGANATSKEGDPVVQAYLQAKMSLFQTFSVKQRKSNSSLATSQS